MTNQHGPNSFPEYGIIKNSMSLLQGASFSLLDTSIAHSRLLLYQHPNGPKMPTTGDQSSQQPHKHRIDLIIQIAAKLFHIDDINNWSLCVFFRTRPPSKLDEILVCRQRRYYFYSVTRARESTSTSWERERNTEYSGRSSSYSRCHCIGTAHDIYCQAPTKRGHQ